MRLTNVTRRRDVTAGTYMRLTSLIPCSDVLTGWYLKELELFDKYLTNIITKLQFVKKNGRLAIHNIGIVRLIKVKSKVNVYVAITL